MRSSPLATEYSRREGLVSAVGDHNTKGVSRQGFAMNDEMLKIPNWDYFNQPLEADMRQTRLRGAFLSQSARYFRPE